MSRRVTAKEWQERVAAWKRSGKSAVEFGAARGIDPQQLRWWRWSLRKRATEAAAAERDETKEPAPGVTFLPVHVRTEGVPVPTNDASVEVVAPGGVVIRLRAECDPRWLAALVRLLGSQEAARC